MNDYLADKYTKLRPSNPEEALSDSAASES
jgi:tetratricopeptide (TPR) repeat protein